MAYGRPIIMHMGQGQFLGKKVLIRNAVNQLSTSSITVSSAVDFHPA